MFNFEIFEKNEESPETIFNREKTVSRDFIENEESVLDQGIRPLVEKLNSLPFLYTSSTGSCEGHVRVTKEKGKYWPGYIHFNIDDSEEGKRFVEELKAIIVKFPNASLGERTEPSEYGGTHFSGGFMVYFDKASKNGLVFPKSEAIQFESEGKTIIKEIETLVDKFISLIYLPQE